MRVNRALQNLDCKLFILGKSGANLASADRVPFGRPQLETVRNVHGGKKSSEGMSTCPVSSENEIAAEALTVNEFMRAYKLGRSSVYKLIRAKKLQSKKILGKRLILVSSAKALLDPDEPSAPIAA